MHSQHSSFSPLHQFARRLCRATLIRAVGVPFEMGFHTTLRAFSGRKAYRRSVNSRATGVYGKAAVTQAIFEMIRV